MDYRFFLLGQKTGNMSRSAYFTHERTYFYMDLSRYPDTLFVMSVMLYPYLVVASSTPIFIVSCKPNSITKIPTINHQSSPPPGEQSTLERWSLVFFTRPGNSKTLRALKESSQIIAAAVASKPDSEFETASTAEDWFARRIKYQRVANRKVCTDLFVPLC